MHNSLGPHVYSGPITTTNGNRLDGGKGKRGTRIQRLHPLEYTLSTDKS